MHSFFVNKNVHKRTLKLPMGKMNDSYKLLFFCKITFFTDDVKLHFI